MIYARKMAAKAARPAIAIELPTVLAAPVKGVIGEPVGFVDEPVPDATPEPDAAGGPLAGLPPTGAGLPGVGGTAVAETGLPAAGLPEAGDSAPGEPAAGDSAAGEPAAGDGATVTVWVAVTVTAAAGQDGQVGQVSAPCSAGLEATGAAELAGGAAAGDVAASCSGAAGVVAATAAAAGELVTGTTIEVVIGVFSAGHSLTVGAQLVMTISLVLRTVTSSSAAGAGVATGAPVTCA